MKPLENVWRELLSRRLLPIAVLLVAALAAIPFLLAKSPAPVAPTTSPVSPGADTSKVAAYGDDSVVALVGDGERTKRRRVLGARKNPFEPGPAPKGAKKADSTTLPSTTTPSGEAGGTGGAVSGDTGGAPTSGGASTPPVTTPPSSAPPASAPPAPKPQYEINSLTVRFGDSAGAEIPKMNLPRLQALPSAEDPVLVYLGLTKDKESAIFMVDSNVEAQGDGSCDPSPANCETIKLHIGDTEFFDVKGENGQTTAQYELDLIKVHTSKTASASAAKAARAKVSKSGRKVLRVRKAQRGPLRWNYDLKSGTVHRLDRKAYKAAVARTARIALAFSGGF